MGSVVATGTYLWLEHGWVSSLFLPQRGSGILTQIMGPPNFVAE